MKVTINYLASEHELSKKFSLTYLLLFGLIFTFTVLIYFTLLSRKSYAAVDGEPGLISRGRSNISLHIPAYVNTKKTKNGSLLFSTNIYPGYYQLRIPGTNSKDTIISADEVTNLKKTDLMHRLKSVNSNDKHFISVIVEAL